MNSEITKRALNVLNENIVLSNVNDVILDSCKNYQ